jgi:hypothetical protein
MVKLDLDTLPTVPDDPPAAGPDRALDPPPPGPGAPAGRLPDTGCAAEADGDVAETDGESDNRRRHRGGQQQLPYLSEAWPLGLGH